MRLPRTGDYSTFSAIMAQIYETAAAWGETRNPPEHESAFTSRDREGAEVIGYRPHQNRNLNVACTVRMAFAAVGSPNCGLSTIVFHEVYVT